MIKQRQMTSLDTNQLPRYTYDEEYNAQRVIIVGGEDLSPFKESGVNSLPGQKNEARIEYIPVTTVEKIEIPTIIKEIEVRTIEIPIIVVETKILEIEKRIIVTEYKEIQVPVIVKEYKEIEVPIIHTQEKIVYVDRTNYKLLYLMQGITLALIVLSKFIK